MILLDLVLPIATDALRFTVPHVNHLITILLAIYLAHDHYDPCVLTSSTINAWRTIHKQQLLFPFVLVPRQDSSSS